jgi:hypothetical protein
MAIACYYVASFCRCSLTQLQEKAVIEKDAPLSPSAQSRLSNNWGRHFTGSIIASILGGMVLLFGIIAQLAEQELYLKFILIISSIIAASWLIPWIIFGMSYHRKKQAILKENEEDYHQSLQLKDGLEKFTSTNATDFSVVEDDVAGDWRPFRIEHLVSNSMRGDIVGRVSLYGLFNSSGTIEARSHGLTTPNLIDSSSMLFLKESSGETLRVLIPSPRATRELLAGMLEGWLGRVDKRYWCDNSHVRNVLWDFAIEDDLLLRPVSHPQLIDRLDASCESTLGERPQVKVIGEPIQDGVVLATALEVNGERNVFLPSGFFHQLHADVSPFFKKTDEPKMISTVEAKQ